MELRKFYEAKGVDYDAFLRRLMGRESLIEKYIKIFLADPTYRELASAVSAKNYGQAGEKAHTLKGIALNLDLEKLSSLCVTIINSVHTGNMQEIEGQFGRLTLEYESIVSELQG